MGRFKTPARARRGVMASTRAAVAFRITTTVTMTREIFCEPSRLLRASGRHVARRPAHLPPRASARARLTTSVVAALAPPGLASSTPGARSTRRVVPPRGAPASRPGAMSPSPDRSACLLALDLDAGDAHLASRVSRASAWCASRGVHRLLVYLVGERARRPATASALAALETLYHAVAREAPTLDAVPALEGLGWNPDAVARALPAEARVLDPDAPLARDVQAARARANLPPLEPDTTDADRDVPGVVPELSPEPSPEPSPGTPSPGTPSPFARLSVGGTFDRMHAGHRLLLAVSSACAPPGGVVFVGVTGDALLVNKRHRHLVQAYDDRADAAETFLRATRGPTAEIELRVGPLDAGLPLAATVRDMDALVVSRETVAGADAINVARVERGFAPLAVVAVGLVGGGEGAGAEEKLSSTALRAAEAAAEDTRRGTSA